MAPARRAASRTALSLALLALVALLGSSARAQTRARLRQLTEQYCRANNLPMRAVNLNLPGRNVERLVVPVLANTSQSFEQTFGTANGAMVYRCPSNDNIHVQLSLGTNEYMAYGSGNQGYFAQRYRQQNPVMTPAYGGLYCAFGLNPQEINHALNFWATDGVGWNTYLQRHPGAQQRAGCMWWLVSAESGPGQSLWHRLGVSRSATPANLLPKLIHAGNEWVGPVGVPVNSLDQFNAMTDQQLLGPPPGGGAADAIR
ncbi:MAG: hypothetical protein IT371_22460 [Deltaproteobacteria bacterium]|nr:hypothetical protein [Deltaproteobacteria bacterium]